MDVGVRRVVRGGEAGGGGKCTVSSRLKLSPTPRTNEPCFQASAGCRKLSPHPRGRATLRGRRQSVPSTRSTTSAHAARLAPHPMRHTDMCWQKSMPRVKRTCSLISTSTHDVMT